MIQGNPQHAFKRWYNKYNRKQMRKMNEIHNDATMMRFKFPLSAHDDPQWDEPMFKPFDWEKFLGGLKWPKLN